MSATLELPSQVNVEATVFDLTGRRVKSVVSGAMSGQVLIHWDGTDDAGHTAHSGIYMLRVRAGTTDLQTKVLLVR
jgi:flagellar hook assembly protein FlgD